jgi:hypothetical protein
VAKYEGKAFDVNRKQNPSAYRGAVQRVANMAVRSDDDTIEAGKLWYPEVNRATRRGSLEIGISARHGAGIVAAVSPNMDFDNNNIHALSEVRGLGKSEWAMIHASAQENSRLPQKERKRNPEVRDMLNELAPSIARAPDGNLVKAHRILMGEDPDNVLLRRTAPKTNSFFHNIADPTSDHAVTIDGRQADIIANQMRPWTWSGRGISSAGLTRGRSRYEDHEDVMRSAVKSAARMDPRLQGVNAVDLQAITWLSGKQFELSTPTVSGKARVKGPTRQGQRYV